MTIRKSIGLASFAMLFVVNASGPVQSQDRDRDRDRGRGRWEFLGSSHVDGAVDHDNISVGMRDGRFRSIQLRVRGGAVEFQRVVIHYGDGEPEDIAVRERIRAGGNTRAIDLRGSTRYIRSVELWYSKDRWRTRPEVQLYGMR